MADREISESKLSAAIKARVAKAEIDIQAWGDKFKQSPSYQLEWADGIFETVAQNEVDKEILGGLKAGRSVEEIEKYATEQALRMARSPSRSTSTGNNYLHLMTTRAWARVLDDIRWRV